MVKSCCAYGCNEKFLKEGPVTFHRFPKNDVRRRAWEVQLRRENFKASDYTKLCSKHFTEDCFDKNKFGGTWLKPDALPTIFNFTDHQPKKFKKRKLKVQSAQNEDVDDTGKEIQKRRKNMKDNFVKATKMEGGKSDERETKRPYIHQRHVGREIYGGRSSGTASVKEEKGEQHIPLEPTVEIKKEPMDYYPTPSTPNDASNEEFSLSKEDNSRTAPDPVVAPQFTLSVAALSSPYAPETSDDEQLKKTRKTNSSTMTPAVPLASPPGVTSQSPASSIGESSSPGTLKEPRKDQLDAFGDYIIAKLRSLDWRSSTFAQKAIVDIVFEAEMGKFLKEDCEYKVLKYSAS